MWISAKSPRTAYDLDPASLFLAGERSDAAAVGSGNKAMGKPPLLVLKLGQFKACRTWGSIITIKSS